MKLLTKLAAILSLSLPISPLLPLLSASVFAADAKVKDGVLYLDDGSEVRHFGVNYSAPFAFTYRAMVQSGVDMHAAIDMDVAHLKRLGVTGYRVHVFDREVSDAKGNLLDNVHLELLDYLLNKLAANGIRAIITPIAWWGNGYPAPDTETQGFANGFTKAEMNTDPKAIAATHTYLKQFFAHKNRYSGVTYGQDANIIAFELFNEPSHHGDVNQSQSYINGLIKVSHESGVTKPLFYNISEQGDNQAFAKAVCDSNIDGIAYQWYPTGLVKMSRINSNTLPNVAHYTNPFADIEACKTKAKMIYEFDAADVTGSVMYPAMARSFREAGFQWATQFAYDSAVIANSNAEYNTHFLNLLYTPSKAISFLIAGEVFRQVPRGFEGGSYPTTYPKNNHFADVSLDYLHDVSVLNQPERFYYSNSTDAKPHAPKKLEHIAGVGSSAIVRYDGNGSYFLDKLSDGLWQLEVYPDALALTDPHQNSSLKREAVRLYQASRHLNLTLPDLGQQYWLQGINQGKVQNRTLSLQASKGSVKLMPGKYLLAKDRSLFSSTKAKVDDHYYLPPMPHQTLALVHQNLQARNQGDALTFSASVMDAKAIDKVELYVRYLGDSEFKVYPMEAHGSVYRQTLTDVKNWQRTGAIEYAFVVTQASVQTSFPGNAEGNPNEWDFVKSRGAAFYQFEWRAKGTPVSLFNASFDRDNLIYPQNARSEWRFQSGVRDQGLGLQLYIPSLVTSATGSEEDNVLVRISPAKDNGLSQRNLKGYDAVQLRIYADQANEHVSVALLNEHGLAYGAVVTLQAGWQSITMPVADLSPMPTVLTKAYPMFMPMNYPHSEPYTFDAEALSKLQGVQLGFVAKDYEIKARDKGHNLVLSEINLIKR
ncbi:MAG: hypothetical protein KJ856_03755 [Gammaproteobacteria bacterium]|nr:hypothetical protein [Gammaproteobacteria bacterium]MBU1480009.1 hypothetical protein [Gammaproteobacteria bacterium]MBU1999809.1 hypothetical protein [Gammaproteobacteria bacterium]MBU2134023.1 hypothetical protein [Gammaproteobacteria bacterium]MBU2186131.1 hypothetical protein [Gammaproteobacteria bacterium]